MSSRELKPTILYDIPCLTKGRPWSPNTMKTRYSFGYKKLPFTTVWVELPGIAGLLQSKGITNSPYTLPAIEDPNAGGKVIVDSLAIATYLDEAYPKTPKVLGPEVRAALDEAGNAFSFGSGENRTDDFAPRLVFLVLAGARLTPVSKDYYYRTRAVRPGELWATLVDDCCAQGEARAERVRKGIESIRIVWHKMALLYHESDSKYVSESGTTSGPVFAFGDQPCFFDFVVAGRVKFAMEAMEPAEAKPLADLEGGRLAKLVEDLERYCEN